MKCPDTYLDDRGIWRCKKCGGFGECVCFDGFEDPICDCGWPAYACCCKEQDELEEFLYCQIEDE